MQQEISHGAETQPDKQKYASRDSLRRRAFAACLLALIVLAGSIYGILSRQISQSQVQQVDNLLLARVNELRHNMVYGRDSGTPDAQPSILIYFYKGNVEAARLTSDWPSGCQSEGNNQIGIIQSRPCSNGRRLDYIETPVSLTPNTSTILTTWVVYRTESALSEISHAELAGLAVLMLLIGYFASAWISQSLEAPLAQLALGAEQISSGHISLRLKSSGITEVDQLTSAFNHMAKSIEERERHIRQTAYIDNLTGLENRAFLHLALTERLQLAREPLAIMCWGIDNLDSINEVLGHDIATKVLERTARKARRICKNRIVLARLEGNVFCAVLPMNIAKKLIQPILHLRHINSMIQVGPYSLDVECHIGAAYSPKDGGTADTLLRRAEIARQLSKKMQRAIVEFEPKLEIRANRRLALLSELRRAVQEDEFELYFQPKLNVRNNTITQAEVLLRWNHPTRGIIAPGGFIQLAEQTGLIKDISRRVLERVHELSGPCMEQNIRLSMNLSALDLEDRSLLQYAQELAEKSPEAARQITLEITESAAMRDPEKAREVLEGFAALGYMVSIDDFGAGYSSLAYLKRFPVSELKIDRSLVQNCDLDTDSAIILESTIEMGHIMGLVVTTEGVETQEEFRVVSELGADYIQGYWLSMPIPYEEFLFKHLACTYDQEIQPIQ